MKGVVFGSAGSDRFRGKGGGENFREKVKSGARISMWELRV